ncbi:MAG TPA: phosphoglucosamine mutase [Bryobacteraceae bacterium]|nr:phosphoglucosamine mutase [Bryobacteraceae bacterium]
MSNTRKLFGTDGIRGQAGKAPLDPETVYALGRALGEWASAHGQSPEVVIGMDTRESGPELASEIAGGLRDAGVASRFAGLITTPGVAWLTRTRDFVAGVMISASHNPYEDNGIKVFDHSGFKLPDDQERQLESRIFELISAGVTPRPASLTIDEGLDEAYIDFLVQVTGSSFKGMRLVLDCANGAASHLATDLFSRLGAEVHTIGCSPNGRNINLDCGALHVDNLRAEVLRSEADAGVAFDGDADRCIMVAASGRIVDGDAALLIIARSLKESGRLRQPVVVATVMSNIGLERALKAEGLGMLRTAVGDKYVLEEMVRRDAQIGGEQSGHVILRDWATTGDGMLTALVVLDTAARSRRTLDELADAFRVFPQTLVNVRFRERKPLDEMPKVQGEIRAAESAFGEEGRVVVRFSGTEPLARVMVEGPDDASVHHWAGRIAAAIREEIGG